VSTNSRGSPLDPLSSAEETLNRRRTALPHWFSWNWSVGSHVQLMGPTMGTVVFEGFEKETKRSVILKLTN